MQEEARLSVGNRAKDHPWEGTGVRLSREPPTWRAPMALDRDRVAAHPLAAVAGEHIKGISSTTGGITQLLSLEVLVTLRPRRRRRPKWSRPRSQPTITQRLTMFKACLLTNPQVPLQGGHASELQDAHS